MPIYYYYERLLQKDKHKLIINYAIYILTFYYEKQELCMPAEDYDIS